MSPPTLLVGFQLVQPTMENSMDVSYKTKNSYQVILQSYFWEYTQIIKKDTFILMFIAALFTRATLLCLSSYTELFFHGLL